MALPGIENVAIAAFKSLATMSGFWKCSRNRSRLGAENIPPRVIETSSLALVVLFAIFVAGPLVTLKGQGYRH
jgi:hypothetical protein